MLRLSEPRRAALALAIAALAAAWVPARLLTEPEKARGRDAAYDQELEWQARRLEPVRPFLSYRAGYCFASPPGEVASLPAPRYVERRVRALFMAQNALAPTVLVAVLGQPQNGVREPSPENRAAALAGLDVLVLDAPASAAGCADPRAAGFEPERAFPAGPSLWRRVR